MTFSAAFVGADATPSPTAAANDSFTILGMDPLMLGMIVVLIILVFFMWRNSRKRKAEAEKMTQSMVPGAEVMTNFGLFGKIVSLDSVANTAELEIAPGVVTKVHRQTLVRVVDSPAGPAEPGAPRSVEEAMAIAEKEQQEREAAAQGEAPAPVADEPKYGERLPEASAEADKADGDSKN